ncbi:MAG: DUF2029 domain-containing protein [Bacteroidia bacterium]|nr:DUF2029 domain-containing protein [Bacteroidia bacterium]
MRTLVRGVVLTDLLTVCAGTILSVIVWITSETSEGGTDAIMHYGIAKYSWQHPELFLDLWGKPLFTIFSSPFAQGGAGAHGFFNILVSAATAWLVIRTAGKLGLYSAWFAGAVLFLFPVWLPLTFSTMTEPLFAFLLAWAVYALFSGKDITAAVVVSFLPFARQEGFAFIILFALLFVLRKEWKRIPWLATGTLFFSLAGALVFNDIFWVLEQQPYHADDFTRTGDPFHYFLSYNGLFGVAGSILLVAGSAWMIQRGRRMKQWNDWLPAAGFFMVLAAHSYVNYKGQAGAIGLLRVMATVAPLAALLVLAGLQWIRKSRMFIPAGWFLLLLQGFLTWRAVDLPLRENPVQRAVQEFSSTFPEGDKQHRKIYSTDPMFWYYFNRDFWDEEGWVQVNHKGHYGKMTNGSLLLVDAHWGKWMDKRELMQRPEIHLKRIFFAREFLPYESGNYSIYIFETDSGRKSDNFRTEREWLIKDPFPRNTPPVP